jgi:hypothetical protein
MGAVKHKLDIQYVETSALEQHPDNANSGDTEAIKDSIDVNGFFAPLVVQRKTHRILAGNHRYVAAIAAGMSEVPVVYVEVSDIEAKRIMVADNRTTRLGHDDEAMMADLLEELYNSNDGLFGTGYTLEDYDELIELGGSPLELPDATDEPERHVEFTAGGDKGPHRERLPFSLEPQVDDDGDCETVTLIKHGGEPIMARDFNALRVALGMTPLTRDELATYSVPRWNRK